MDARTRLRVSHIVRALGRYDPERVILFGSAARGDTDPYSDIDLIVIKNTTRRFLDRLERVYELLQGEFALDALVYTPGEFSALQARENPFIERILKEGVTIYESNMSCRPARKVNK